jgi:nitrogen fixation/metabolism regulation signal transduction histidine kinase
LAATLWIATSFLEISLSYTSTAELDQLSRSLELIGRKFYQRAQDDLKNGVATGRIAPSRYQPADREHWPEPVKEFAESGEADRYVRSGEQGDRLDYLARHGTEIWRYSEPLGGVAMDRLSDQYHRARELVQRREERNLRRGFTYPVLLLAACVWMISLALLIYFAHRISHPIQQLTAGLTQLASGDLTTRVEDGRDDEIGRAIQAFNDMAGQLRESTKRLVYLTQLASWQSLARKMAHEVKNSLTPIRLTVEEMLARQQVPDRAFIEQAAQIVVEEVESLERRVRAFSEFAAEPPLNPSPLDVNALLEERVTFLRSAHPEVTYSLRLAADRPCAQADPDLVKGILTNLLENAAEAAGSGGRILGISSLEDGKVILEVHDSGPGLSDPVRRSLFQPTISFKKRGMGLGLSIARKSALLSGGDILAVQGELGGAGFRVLLPVRSNGVQARPDRG